MRRGRGGRLAARGSRAFEYCVHIEGGRHGSLAQLAERLRLTPGLVEFELSRVSN